MRKWQALLLNKERKEGLILLPKCASRFVRTKQLCTKRGWDITLPTKEEDIPNDYLMTAFIRYPLDRVVSCWAYFQNRNKDYGRGKEFRSYVNSSFPRFCDYVYNTPNFLLDKHCASQYYLLEGRAHRYIKWDFIELNDYLGVTLPTVKSNTSQREEWESYYTPDLFNKMTLKYRDDLRLWQHT